MLNVCKIPAAKDFCAYLMKSQIAQLHLDLQKTQPRNAKKKTPLDAGKSSAAFMPNSLRSAQFSNPAIQDTECR